MGLMEIHVLEKYGERMERRIAMLNRVIRKVTAVKVALYHDLKEMSYVDIWGETYQTKKGQQMQRTKVRTCLTC